MHLIQYVMLDYLLVLFNQICLSISMNELFESKSVLNPITGDQIGKPSENYQYNMTMTGFYNTKNQKSNLVKSNYIDQETLQEKVKEFMDSKLSAQQTFQPHEEFCLCADCIYARQLAKINSSGLSISMRTVYKQQFKDFINDKESSILSRTKASKQLDEYSGKVVNQLADTNISPKKKVSNVSLYGMDFSEYVNNAKTKQKAHELKTQDKLKFDGPFQNITSYGNGFPGVSGGNPYVKPVDKAVRQNFKLDARTTYSTKFVGNMIIRPALAKSPDNIRTGLPMLIKQSTSTKFYSHNQNPQKYQTKYNRSPAKRQASLDYKHQYESTYRTSFYGDSVDNCRGKRMLFKNTLAKLGITPQQYAAK